MKLMVLFLLVIAFSLSAKIYKYKDSYGRTHYVDDISKVPSNKINYVKSLNNKFLKTGHKKIDKYRRLVLKKGVYYKELQNQKNTLIAWVSIMINYGFKEFEIDLSRLSAIKLVNKKGKKLKRRQARKVSITLSHYFKSFENAWPKVYEEVNFKSAGSRSIDIMRKNRKILKTSSENLSIRIKLLEEWADIMKEAKKYDIKLITERMNKISALYDVPKPNLKVLFKYVDKTVFIFEKEFRK